MAFSVPYMASKGNGVSTEYDEHGVKTSESAFYFIFIFFAGGAKGNVSASLSIKMWIAGYQR